LAPACAFLTLRRAAARCFSVAIAVSFHAVGLKIAEEISIA
jgi:hypothetical protein